MVLGRNIRVTVQATINSTNSTRTTTLLVVKIKFFKAILKKALIYVT